jgi:plasmid stabilization system protein ParE
LPGLRWLPEALRDVDRLHGFLKQKSPEAARRAAALILAGADTLGRHPEIGRPMSDGTGRRELVLPFGAGGYVLRYMLDGEGSPVVIRVWHSLENRPR